MIEAIHKHSILRKNGENLIVNCSQWAEEALTGAALTQFRSDWQEHIDYIEQAFTQQIASQEDIVEDIQIEGKNYKISVGIRFIMPDDWVDHPKFTYWQEQMRLDPNIIVYNSPEIQPS